MVSRLSHERLELILFPRNSVGDSAFFVLDTRAYRSPNENADDEAKTMLGDVQREVFLNWAAEVNQTVTWKFIASSVPMMSLWSECLSSSRPNRTELTRRVVVDHAEDTWAGFLAERDLILDTLQYVPNVIVLSGVSHDLCSPSTGRNAHVRLLSGPSRICFGGHPRRGDGVLNFAVSFAFSLALTAAGSNSSVSTQLQHVLSADSHARSVARSRCFG